MVPATLLGADERARVAALAAAIEEARGRYAGAAPVAEGDLTERPIDRGRLAAATRAVAVVLRERGALGDEELGAIHARADLAGDVPALLAWASGERTSPPFAQAPVVWSVMRLALPALMGPPSVREDAADEGRCPACGMAPDLATILSSGARYLVCGVCDTAWRADRVRCPFCGTSRAGRIADLAGDVAGALLRVCDDCGTYIKTVDRRRLRGDEGPLLLRLLTAEMDARAAEAGYRPGP